MASKVLSQLSEETMESSLALPEIKFFSLKSRIDSCRSGSYKYSPTEDPVKDAAKLYIDFIRSLRLDYEPDSIVPLAFAKLLQDCKQGRVGVHEVELKAMWLFKSRPKHLVNFYNTVLPYLYPLTTKDEVDRANQFIRSVKAAFPNNINLCASVILSVLRFQEGKTTLKEMTAEVLELLGKRDDLVEAYFKFVPQAQIFRSKGKFFSYPAIAGILVVSAIGLSKIRK